MAKMLWMCVGNCYTQIPQEVGSRTIDHVVDRQRLVELVLWFYAFVPFVRPFGDDMLTIYSILSGVVETCSSKTMM